MIAIGKDRERPDAELFHVDCIKGGAGPATRPVTFLVNGGPGGASIFLHIAAVGPLAIASPRDGTFPAVPATLEPNPDSWIDFTDLVFIDPVGTGYSRMLPAPDGQPGDPSKYCAVDSDMHSIAWFIRQWLTANDRWGSPKALEEFERFALNELASGLVKLGRSDAASAKTFHDTVAGMIGLDPDYVARKRARVGVQDFVTTLLQDKGLMIDRYDGTVATENPIPELSGLNVMDRSLAALTGVLLPPFMDYVRGDLGYQTDRNYIPLNVEVNLAWDRSSATGGPDDLALALAQNPGLRALVVHGMHDLSTPYFLSKYVLEQSVVTPEARKRLYFGVYPGGHMFDLQKASRAEFAADVRTFYEGAK